MSELLLTYFTILSREQLLICNDCKSAVSSKAFRRHLSQFHKIIPGPIRRELSREVSTLILNDGIIDMIPIEPVKAFQCLDIIKGFHCTICFHCTGIEDSIKGHYRREHRDNLPQWEIPQGMSSSTPLIHS
jgi:hypothetical protein